ncbi:hypothetical protein [Polymorphospora rubra]|uniref:FtsK domain-containing protein n=1 Tax=Polymorphospora rubra TaxID=338584 RepID=A0A810MUA6_9ACTN|nr:hypothetical protein [Polymorphospora rubra]BCJ64164.1 hypothetical protein Prubr_11850 [Polymorphospora rubra]
MGATKSGAVWVPAWVIVILLAAVALRLPGVPVSWWLPLGLAPLAALGAVLIAAALDRMAAAIHRGVAALAAGIWVAVVAGWGWSGPAVVALGIGAGVVLVLELLLAPAAERLTPWQANQLVALPAAPPVEQRPPDVLQWEAMLTRLFKKPIRVTAIHPWDEPRDGQRVHIDLPEDMTLKTVAALCDTIAAARRLPVGCVVRALPAAHQGAAILDVMLRDCLAGEGRMLAEPTTPASINDPFDVATTARGERLEVCLRQKSMIVGGTTGSGKTTALNRLIMFLARCTDTLIWVVDLNGGGVAVPWVGPWARGDATAPVVDWVATNDVEAAVMVATAAAVAKDRKVNREAVRRKRAANSTVLPVDAALPAILILADEGAEIRQTIGLLASLVDEGIARVAQIGRAEGVRVVMSVLRGTGDLLGKGLRAVVGIRLCMRMDEEGECDHVLGRNPGRTPLLHVGSAYLFRTDKDLTPVLARTVDVDLASIERHSIATAGLRPRLDERAQRIAARLTVADVIEGRDPKKFEGLLEHPTMREVAAGRAYAGRWDRAAAMLAELREEDLGDDLDDEPAAPVVPAGPLTAAPAGSAAEQFLLAMGVTRNSQPAKPAPDPVEREAAALLSEAHLAQPAAQHAAPAPAVPGGVPTTREAILAVLDASRRRLTAAEVRAEVGTLGVDVSAQRVHQVLSALADKGAVAREGDRYELV